MCVKHDEDDDVLFQETQGRTKRDSTKNRVCFGPEKCIFFFYFFSSSNMIVKCCFLNIPATTTTTKRTITQNQKPMIWRRISGMHVVHTFTIPTQPGLVFFIQEKVLFKHILYTFCGQLCVCVCLFFLKKKWRTCFCCLLF